MRNKYAGPCYRCKDPVPAGRGFFERHAGAWRVHHVECCETAREERRLAAIEAKRRITIDEFADIINKVGT